MSRITLAGRSSIPTSDLDANFSELYGYALGTAPHATSVGFGTVNADPAFNRVTGMVIRTNGSFLCRQAASHDMGMAGASGTHISFYTDNGSARVTAGVISSSGSTTTFATSSDYRLKTSIVDLEGSGDFIDALRPRSWLWAGGGGQAAGFVAHEFQAVSPASVIGAKNAVDESGQPVYQALQAGSSEVIAHLVAELQSLRRRVAALEAAA